MVLHCLFLGEWYLVYHLRNRDDYYLQFIETARYERPDVQAVHAGLFVFLRSAAPHFSFKFSISMVSDP